MLEQNKFLLEETYYDSLIVCMRHIRIPSSFLGRLVLVSIVSCYYFICFFFFGDL